MYIHRYKHTHTCVYIFPATIGEERHYIDIARGVLKNSPLLIYYEAISSLDSITEQISMSCLNTR